MSYLHNYFRNKATGLFACPSNSFLMPHRPSRNLKLKKLRFERANKIEKPSQKSVNLFNTDMDFDVPALN